MSNKEKLIAYIASLTPEHVDKVCRHMDLLKQLPTLTENELIFTEEFLKRIFTPEGSAA